MKFTSDPNLLISGGWDGLVYFWDIRTTCSVGYILGPHIYGESIDVHNDTLLVGSYSDKEILSLYSLKTRSII